MQPISGTPRAMGYVTPLVEFPLRCHLSLPAHFRLSFPESGQQHSIAHRLGVNVDVISGARFVHEMRTELTTAVVSTRTT